MEAVMLKARQAMQEVARSSPDFMRAALERSKDMAKTAEHIKELALDGAAKVKLPWPPEVTTQAPLDEEELLRYGITPQLRDFVQGLTMDTFRHFPLDDAEMCKVEQVGEIEVSENSSSDLSHWQEQHARLVLSAVPEISEFRYKLCPKFIKESRFWRIYFTLVAGHIACCQSPPRPLAVDGIATQTTESLDEQKPLAAAESHDGQKPIAAENQEEQKLESQKPMTVGSQRNKLDDQDLDAYLMGAGSSDDDEELNDEGFDAEFEQFVNDAALQSDDDEG